MLTAIHSNKNSDALTTTIEKSHQPCPKLDMICLSLICKMSFQISEQDNKDR